MLAKSLFAISIATLPLMIACSSDSTPDDPPPTALETGKPAALETTPSIPRTSKKSPLAQLMRVMTAHADSVRAALKRGEDLPPYPTQVNELFTAASTDSTLDRTTYTIFAKDYIGKLKALYDAPAADQAQVYNGLVTSCATCHGTLCPGPLVLIRKMYAPLPEKAP
ncbi:MAG: hypothetical protein WAU70_13200 [Flavobacteriales bacterium]